MTMEETDSRDYPQQPQVAVGAPSADLWAVPGGRVRLGESLQQAAEREIFEETGVRIAAGEPVYTFDHIERDAHGRIRFHYVIVDFRADYLDGEVRAGDDARDARWVSPTELAQLHVSPTTRKLLKERFGFGG